MSKRLGKKCPRVGVRVAHASLGSGTVTRVETARGKRACVGDLVYVRFADDRVVAVAKSDVTKGKASKLGDVWRLRQQGKDAPDSGRVLEVHPGDYLVNDGTSLEPFRLPQYATGKQLVTKLDDEWANQQRASIRARAQKAPHVRRYFEEHPEEAGALFGLGAEEAARGNQWSIRGHLFYAWGLKPMGPKLSPSAYDRWGIAQGSPGTWELTFDMRRPGEVVVLGHSYEGGRSSGDPTYFTSSTRDAGGNLRVSTVADVVQALAVDGLFSLRGVFWQGRDEPELLLTTTFSREQREALLVWLDGAQSRGSSLGAARTVTIPAAHLREDIREAHQMVRELERGIRRDKKALGDVNQRRVDSTDLPNAFVSTVWEPVDGRFETKVFPMRNGTVEWTGIDWASAKTFEEARKNHRAMVLRWQSREIDPATFGNMSWFPKPGRDALDPQNRVVYIVSINGNMATVKLAGPYGAHVQLPVSSLRSPE